MKDNKRSFKIVAIFSLITFLVLILTITISFLFTVLLLHFGIIQGPNLLLPLVMFAISSLIVGTILSKCAGKRPIGTIVEISEATKEVAKGNFDVQLDENTRAIELHTMAHNFNIMTKELAKTELFRNDFIENVSHEFKTPLSAIEGYVTLLQKKGLSEEKKEEYAERILKSTKRLSDLTGNILLLSCLENHELEVKKEYFLLDEQLRECILMLEDRWSEKEIDLDIDLETIEYYGNRELLSHVWQNMIGNAVKFTPFRGKISVLLRQFSSKICVTIKDTGIGMNSDIIDRIYEKFYQGDSSRAGAGNGLGLTLAKRIIDLHGGTIKVSSEENHGTTFTVFLPR